MLSRAAPGLKTAVCCLEYLSLSYEQQACPVTQQPFCCMQAVKEALDIPVLANGNIRHLQVSCCPPQLTCSS